MKKEFFQEIVKPFLVLVIICVAAAGVLALTNEATKPIIDENARMEAEQTRKAVLPDATEFEEIPCEESWGIDSAYRDAGGSGYVFTASAKGYGGDVVVTLGVDTEGKILNMKVDASTETQGIGSKTAKTEYTDKFLGQDKDSLQVDTITGATFSSKAVKTSVENALKAFEAIRAMEGGN